MQNIQFPIEQIFSNETFQLIEEQNIDAIEKLLQKNAFAAKTLKNVCEYLSTIEPLNFQGHSHTLLDIQKMLQDGFSYEEIISKDNEIDIDKFFQFKQVFMMTFSSQIRLSFIEVILDYSQKDYTNEEKQQHIKEVFNQTLIDTLFTNHRCDACGTHLKTISAFGGKNDLHCIMDIDEIQEVFIDVPSGTLMCGDWFRDDYNTVDLATSIANSKALTTLKNTPDFTVNSEMSALGEYAQILACADQNMISIYVGNTSPSVLNEGHKITIAHTEDDNPHMEASICTDLWRASLIDKQFLTEMFAQKYTKNQLNQVFEDLSDDGAFEIKVKPGTYKVTYNTRYKPIYEKDGDKVFFTLELM